MGVERIGRAVLEIATDATSFFKGLNEIDPAMKGLAGSLKGFGSSMKDAGGTLTALVTGPLAGAAASFLALAKTTAAAGDEIANQARTAGVSGTTFQELSYAMSQVSRVGAESLTKALSKITVTIGLAAEGNKKAAESLVALGFSEEQVAAGTLTAEQAFMKLSEATRAASTDAAAHGIAADLLGRKLGPEFSGALRASGDQISGLRDRARELGLVMSNEALVAADNFDDTLDELTRQIAGVGREIGSAVLPIIVNDLIPAIREHVIPAVREWVGHLKSVIEWFGALPGPVKAAAAIIAGVFAAAGPILIGIGLFASAMGGLVAASGPIAAVGGALVALATGPIGIIVAAIAGLTTVWLVWGDDIKRIAGDVVDWVGDKFTAFKESVVGVWNAIVDGVRAAIAGVKKILDAVPSTVLLPLIGPIGLVLATFKHWDEITEIARKVYEGVKTWLVEKFAAVVKWIGEKVGQVTGFFRDMYDKVVGHSFVPDMMRRIGTEFGRLPAVMVEPTASATRAVGSRFSGLLTELTGLLGPRWSGVVTGFVGLWGSARDSMDGVSDSIFGDFSVFMEALSGLFGERFGGIVSTIGGIFTELRGLLQVESDGILSYFSSTIEKIVKFIQDARSWWDELREFFGGKKGGGSTPTFPVPGTGGPAPPRFATGGIVTAPTLGLVGEAGPEAIIPLNRLGEFAPGRDDALEGHLRGLRAEVGALHREFKLLPNALMAAAMRMA